MITRPLPDRTPADAARLTEDQRAVILAAHTLMRERIAPALQDDPMAAFILHGERNSQGWAGRHRLLGLLKVCIADGGRVLLSPNLRRIIEFEATIPWEVHYWDTLIGPPRHRDLVGLSDVSMPDYDTTFYRTVPPGYQTKRQLQYSQGAWLPATVLGVPSLADVSDEEALHFLGRTGVVLDAEHPATPPPHPVLALDDMTLSLPHGVLFSNALMHAYGGLGPYRYAKLRGDPDGITNINEDSGLVSVTLADDTAAGDYAVVYRVVDAMGSSVDATLTVTVEAG